MQWLGIIFNDISVFVNLNLCSNLKERSEGRGSEKKRKKIHHGHGSSTLVYRRDQEDKKEETKRGERNLCRGKRKRDEDRENSIHQAIHQTVKVDTVFGGARTKGEKE